jgi:16S rRNA (adenine1518-N6/adenine1519-N6)-dimethyltransferase
VSHRPRKRFGQHFLAPAWADKVVDAIAPAPGDRFIEIGPGPGILTTRLAARAAHVTAIEVDRDLAAALAARVPRNVEILTHDVIDLDLSPLLASGPVRVAGNLPYNISSPILFKLLAASRSSPNLRDATVMLQREVADRLAARVGTKEYGVLTILIGLHATVQRRLVLPPGAFRPAPKVQSAVVRLTFKPSILPPDLEPLFDRMVKTIFMQRRKTLLNALRPFADARQRTSALILAAAGIDPQRRPETLATEELLRLVQVVL